MTATPAASWLRFSLALLGSFSFVCLVNPGAAHAVPFGDSEDRLIAATPPHTPQQEQKMFHLPPGYRIELVASEPDIVKPINMKFDAAGRLYVTQSYEYPYAAQQGKKHRDTIRRIVDTNGDGIPDKVSVYADGLNIPIGVTPIHGGVFAYSIPELERLLDTNGDGVADKREVAYTGFGFHDTHGMVNNLTYWLDGWVYCCHGFFNTSTVKGTDGSSITMQSGNTFRVRIDGSHVEQISHGQVNPFGMAFDSRGDQYTADCHSRPATLILRGAYYQSFGKPDDGLGFAPDMMHHDHGSTGIASVVYYAADQFPETEHDTIFMGNPVTGRINHDRIETHGSTHTAVELPDFVTCDDRWFRPVDMQLGPDGSIYVADFYNCIIGHYEVPLNHPLRDKTRGRIWRISYVGGDLPPDAEAAPVDLSRAALPQLITALSDTNLAVRTLATQELIDRIDKPSIPSVRALVESAAEPEARAHGVWVLYRLGALDHELFERLAADGESIVRLHTVKALAETLHWADWQHSLAHRKLTDADPFVRRAAADAVGRHPEFDEIDALAELWRNTDKQDAMLIQVTRIALRNVVQDRHDMESLASRYKKSHDMQRRLIEVCRAIPEPRSASLVLAIIQANPKAPQHAAKSLAFVANTIDVARMPEVYRLALLYRGKNRNRERDILMGVIRASHERKTQISPEIKAWTEEVEKSLLADSDDNEVQRGIELAAESGFREAFPTLSALVSGTRFSRLRGPAADALVRVDGGGALPVIKGVCANLSTPLDVRCEVVEALKSVNTPESREFLVSLLKVAPARLAFAIAQTLSHHREGGTALVEAVEKGLCAPRILEDRNLRARLQALEVPKLGGRIDQLLKGLPTADERIAKSLALHTDGFQHAAVDAKHGSAVFQKNCVVCHQIGGKGNRVGPQLDGVGNRGVERMLEDVLDPNRNVDTNFRATILALNDGQVVNGIVVREEGPVLVVVDSKGKEQRIPSSSVEHRTLSKLSPMPSNVSDLLSPQELYDLLAYLLKQRAPGEANR